MTARRMVGSAPGRDRKDFYETPKEAIDALCRVEQFSGVVLDPCCGKGAIVSNLKEWGISSMGSDLHDYGEGFPVRDFFAEYPSNWDHIVMNPPFTLAEQFTRKARTHCRGKVAVLQRLQWLEGRKRRALFLECGLARVWVFSKRLPMMHREGWEGPKASSALAFAWYIFDSTPVDGVQLGWL